MNEQKLAERLLERRDEGTHPARALLPQTPISIIALLVCIGFGLLLILAPGADKESSAFGGLLIGVLIGKHLRDFIWLRDIRAKFPTMRKFIDWSKVEAAARGEGSSIESSAEPE